MTASILTVDDSASIRRTIKIALAAEGYGVTEASDGAEGFRTAEATGFDLIITDLNMPVMNGMEMIRGLRGLPAYAGVPIVFLTTESDEAVKREAKAAGATGWLTKPFKPDQLLSVIAKLVRK